MGVRELNKEKKNFNVTLTFFPYLFKLIAFYHEYHLIRN